MRNKIIVFILLFCPLYLLGQYSNTIHYTVKDGLPSSTVYSAVQDSLGFIWLGTEAGLVRFDGAKFKVYTTQDGLPDNEVLGLLLDSITSRLWIITYSKAVCYYKNGKFYTAKNDSSLSAVTCDFGEFVNGNKQNSLGVFLYNGNSFYKCNEKGVSIYRSKFSGMLCVHQYGDTIFDMLIPPVGMVKYTPSSETIYQKFGENNVFASSATWIGNLFFLYKESQMEVYEKKNNGDYIYRSKISMPPKRFGSCMTLLGDRYLFSVPDVGLYWVDTAFKDDPHNIWSGSVNYFTIDREKNIWITTSDDGIYVIRKENVKNYTAENGLGHNNITALEMEVNGKLFIGTTYGDIFLLEKNKIKPIKASYSVKHEKVRGMTTFGNSMLFITNSLVNYFTLENGPSVNIPHLGGGPKAILNVPDQHKIYIGLASGLLEFDTETGENVPSTTHRRMISMARHPDGHVFCGTLDGIYLYEEKKMTHIECGDSRLNNRVTSMCFSRDSLLWIGTPSSGILIYDGKKVLGQISSNKYLSYTGAICRKIASGKANEMWVATNSGINKIRYHVQDSLIVDNITPLNTVDGILSDDVNDILVNDSLIYVATSQGMTILNDNLLENQSPAPIYISSVRINDADSTIHADEYNLGYWQNNLRIEYVGIILPSAGYIRYQYRLVTGSNEKWETTMNTSMEFRSLSSGEYTFEVAVLDKFGKRSSHIAQVRFLITPVYYKTVWFWGIIFITVLALGFYIIRFRFKQRQVQYEKEQSYNNKIIDLEQQALKAQMNPHFIFNCLTAIQHFVNKEDVYSANMYLSNFAKLIRKTLDLSGEQYISLDKEVAYLENYIQLEKMRFQEEFNYFMNVNSELDVFNVQVPPMLLQPIIENAIRHGLRYKENNEGVLNIDFDMEGNALICKINDNGIGIKRSKELKTNTHVEYQSKGMKLTESRISAINMISDRKINMVVTDKYDDLGNGIGTLVVIRFEQ